MREITLTVRGDTVHASRHRAGIQGEANATVLVVSFDESWDGYAKKITFWDALEQNPVVRGLNVACADRTYKTTIPGEPLALAGECLLVIDGYLDGTRARSMSVRLTVEEAPVADNAGEPVDPTPDQYQELREDIEEIMADILMVKQGVEELRVIKEETIEEAQGINEETVKVKDDAERARQAIEDMSAGGTFVPANSAEPWVEKQVDEDGAVNLHFNIRSGVFVGSGDMPEHCNVQVDPQGRVVTLDDLIGTQGEKGEKGDKGDTGDTGAQGPRGEKGDKGDTGSQGPKGDKGDKGDTGDTGAQGPAGADGKTPVCGVDYFTPEDVEAIVADVTAQVEASFGGTYELVEEITTEEELTSIRREAWPDETPYSFKAMLIKFEVPAGAGTGLCNVTYADEDGWTLAISSINSIATSARYGWSHAFKEFDRWCCEFASASSKYASAVNRMTGYDEMFRKGPIAKIIVTANTANIPFPVGTNIKIYGVRA